MKQLFGLFLILGILNLLYVAIKFVISQQVNGTLILGLILVAGSISGLKIIEMWKRQNKHKNR
jgi:hypothetical protein